MPNVASLEKIEKRKTEILDAAMDVFSQKGFHEAGIADIAKALNIGHGTIYRYYKNKLDIFNAITLQGTESVLKVIADNPPNADSLEEYKQQLQNIANGLSQIFFDDPRYIKINFHQATAVDTNYALHMKDAVALITKEYLKNGVDKGFLRADMNQEVVSYMVTAMMFEIIVQINSKATTREKLNEWNQELLKVMINGIAP